MRRRPGILGTAAVAAALLFAAAAPASAATVPTSDGEARFLGGEVLDIDLDDIVELAGASANSPDGSGPHVEASPLAASVFDAIDIDLGSGVSLLGDNGILSLGAVNQYAEAGPDGIAKAASGAVNDSGAIEVGGSDEFPSNARLDLSGLGGGGVLLLADGDSSILADGDLADLLPISWREYVVDLSLELGALSASAIVDDAAGPVDRDYQIAGAQLVLDSPILRYLKEEVIDRVGDELQPILDDLVGSDGLLGEVFSILDDDDLNQILDLLGTELSIDGSIDVDLNGVLGPILDGSYGSGGVTIDLGAGRLIVDLGELLGGLNDLPPNTEIIDPAVLESILDGIEGALTSLVTDLGLNLVIALNNAAVHLEANGEILDTPVGALTKIDLAIDGTLSQLALGNGTASLTAELLSIPIALNGNDLLGPLGDAIMASAMGDTEGLAGGIADGLLDELGPLANALDALEFILDELPQVLSLVGNVQEDVPVEDGVGALQGALRLGVLGDTISLDLATAVVRSASFEEPEEPTEPGGPSGPSQPQSPPGDLPRTGTNAAAPTMVGLGLLTAGAVIVGIRRRLIA